MVVIRPPIFSHKNGCQEFSVAGVLGLKRFFIEQSTTTIKTNIPVNADWSGSKAFLYLVSGHYMDGDGTYYDFGVIRLGYSGDNMTITSISKNEDLAKSFSISDDGYIQYNTGTSGLLKRVVLIG